jgi:molybdopterin molybdotransferase
MIPVEAARSRILEAFAPLPGETVSLGAALGRVLAEPVLARVSQPPKAVSAMDGYAVRAADVAQVPAVLRQIGEVPAGSAFEGAIGAGACVRIFTGAPLPDGADAIVIQEDTEADGERITIKESAAAGHYVRPAGLDFRAGTTGLTAPRVLTARDIGLAAAMNVPWLRVRRRPRIAILATGDEVVMPGDPLGANQIVSSNGLALSALVTVCGGEALNLGIAADNEDSLRQLAAGATGADLLVTTGGASVGKHDLVHKVLGQEGFALDFWKVAMRPGKPLMFGKAGPTPLLGLPGNPVSALVCGVLFLRPAIGRMLGLAAQEQPQETAVLGADLGPNDRRQDYLRATLSIDGQGRRCAQPYQRQDSSMLATLAYADCLIVRPPLAPAARAGELVEIVPLAGSLLSI